MVDPDTGDTIPEERQWKVHVKDGANLFLRACRLDSTGTGGGIDIWVDGEVRRMEASAAWDEDCAEINRPATGL